MFKYLHPFCFQKGNKMSLEQRAKILEITAVSPCGVREIVHLLKLKTSNVISLLRKMGEEQLIDIQLANGPKKGRPKKCITSTSLGQEFLDAYKKLNLKPLRARKQDLNHAAKDALYASRLVEGGHSPFQIFMELNIIASNIKNSSETHQSIQ
jgi:DNA-binding PadR family transcriptional regulator